MGVNPTPTQHTHTHTHTHTQMQLPSYEMRMLRKVGGGWVHPGAELVSCTARRGAVDGEGPLFRAADERDAQLGDRGDASQTTPGRALKTGVLCRECDQKVSQKTPKRAPKTRVLCRECDQKPRKSSKMLNVRSPPWYLAWKSQKKRSERRKKRARIPSVYAQKTDFAIDF